MNKSINIAKHLLDTQKNQQIENKQYNNNQYVKGVISNQEIKKKMTRLRYELNSLSDKIGKSRDEDVSFAYQKEYQIRQKEFNFLKNFKRRIQSLSVDSQRKISINQAPKNIQRSSSQKRNTSLHQSNASNRLPNLSPQLIIKLKQRLQQKFLDYCKKKSTVPDYFSEVVPESNVMKYKGFLLFMKHAGMEQVLTFEERLRIFNKNSKFKKRLIFRQFQYAIQECCRYICDKHQQKFTQHQFHIFLSNILTKLEISFIVPQNNPIKKLQIHTGLFKQSMQDMIDQSRRNFEVKRTKSIISRKKLLAIIKQPFSLENRSISLKKKQNSINTLQPIVIDSISPFKKRELEPISYTSLMKNHNLYENKNRLVKERMVKGNYQQRHRTNANQRAQYIKEINELVNLDESDSLLQQMLSKSYQK